MSDLSRSKHRSELERQPLPKFHWFGRTWFAPKQSQQVERVRQSLPFFHAVCLVLQVQKAQKDKTFGAFYFLVQSFAVALEYGVLKRLLPFGKF